jgi:Kef-type K+ transport system membrane component KefB
VEVSEFFLKLLVILLAAKLFAEVFCRLSIPPVLSEVVSRIIIGPGILGFTSPDATLHLIAEK